MAKILIVDDDQSFLRLIEALLAPLGYEVVCALSGEEAIELVEEAPPDLILLDILMPGLDGYAVARHIKKNPQISHIPIVMITGLNAVKDRIKALEAGADDFLSKPVDKTELRVRIGSLLKVKAYNDYVKDFQKKLAAEIEEKTHLLQQTNNKLKEALQEKDVLIKEIHHRVKNNMQLVSSLINLQASQTNDNEQIELLKELQTRVRSLSLIHEKLYQSEDLVNIDLSKYIQSLVNNLKIAYEADFHNIGIETEIEKGIFLDSDHAIPCGLIVNELVSNAFKHAFPASESGFVRIAAKKVQGKKAALTVVDNGVGFPDHLDYRETKSLGMQLVNDLVSQLAGTIELTRKEGTAFKVIF